MPTDINTYEDMLKLRRKLEEVLILDRNNSYMVRSLYFDDFNDGDYYAKQNDYYHFFKHCDFHIIFPHS